MSPAGSQVASLYGTLTLEDTFSSGLASAAQTAEGFGGSMGGMLGNVSSMFTSFGQGFTSAVTNPIMAGFRAVTGAAGGLEDANTLLEAHLKSAEAATASMANTQGYWTTVTAGSSQYADQWGKSLKTAQKHLEDMQAQQAAGFPISKTQQQHMAALEGQVGTYQNALAGATNSHKVWVQAMADGATAPKMTVASLEALASGLERTTKFSREQIERSEAMLLTFHKIGSETMPQATQAVLDLAETMGGDTQQAAIQLGKALDDPIKGITALHRVGAEFSETQKHQIKNFEATGQHGKAMKVILDELNGEFGGTASAAADTFNGRLAQLGNQFNDLLIAIGDPIIKGLTPVLGAIGTAIGDIAQSLTQVNPGFVQFGAGIAAAVAAIGPLSMAVGALLSPIGLVAAGVAAVGAAFASNFGNIRTFAEGLLGAVKPGLDKVTSAVQGFYNDLFNPEAQVAKHGSGEHGAITEYIAPPDMGTRLQAAFAKFAPQLAAGLSDLLQSGATWIQTSGWPMLVSGFNTIAGNIANFLRSEGVHNFVAGFADAVTSAGNWIASSAWSLLSNGLSSLMDSVAGFFSGGGATKFIKGITEMITGASTDIGKIDFTAGFSKLLEAVGKFLTSDGVTKIKGSFQNMIGSVLQWMQGDGSTMLNGGAQKIVDAVGGVISDAGKMLQNAMSTAIGAIKTWLDNEGPSQLVTNAGKLIDGMVAGLTDKGADVLTAIQNSVHGVVDWLGKEGKAAVTGAFQGLVSAVGGILAGIAQPIVDAVYSALKQIGNFLVGLPGGIGAGIGGQILGAIPKEKGGPVMGGQMYLVGEKGPELLIPESNGTIIPNDALMRGGSGGSAASGSGSPVINIGTLRIEGVQDADQLLKKIQRAASRQNMAIGSQMG